MQTRQTIDYIFLLIRFEYDVNPRQIITYNYRRQEWDARIMQFQLNFIFAIIINPLI